MTATIERKYAMTRLRSGAYLLMSNDRKSLWLIYRYEEDGSAYWVDKRGRHHEVRGDWWSTAKARRHVLDYDDGGHVIGVRAAVDLAYDNDDATWFFTGEQCKTRQQAIDTALRWDRE